MKKISEFVKYFTVITTAVLIVCGIGYMAYGKTEMPVDTAWKILASAGLTALVTVLFRVDKAFTPVNILIHYLSLCVVMSLMGAWFGWMDFSVPGVLFMCFAVAVVYVLTWLASYLTGRKDAADINKALNERKKQTISEQ